MGEQSGNTRIDSVFYTTGPGLTASNVPAGVGVVQSVSENHSVIPMSALSLSDGDRFVGFTRSGGLTVGQWGTIVVDGPAKVRVGAGGVSPGDQTTLSASGKLITFSATTHMLSLGIAKEAGSSDDFITHWVQGIVLVSGST